MDNMKYLKYDDSINALQKLVGKTITSIEVDANSDEGLAIKTEDGSVLIIGFSSFYGSIILNNEGLNISSFAQD